MDEECCSFKKNDCPVPSFSSSGCLKGDEKICTMAMIIKEKREKEQKNKGGGKNGK